MDDSLLCDEVLVFTPPNVTSEVGDSNNNGDSQGWRRQGSDWRTCSSVAVTPLPLPPSSREDYEESVRTLVDKERNHMPQPGYVKYLESNPMVYNARFNAISWVIECRRRLNISLESVFCAANYIDRFISTRNCQGWECCTFDLLAKACLYVATKFNETDPPSIHAILEKEGRGERHFAAGSSDEMRGMELRVLRTLGWKLHSTTPYSYLQLFMEQQQCVDSTATRLNFFKEDDDDDDTLLLLGPLLLDPRFVEFRASFVAEAALRCILMGEEDLLPPQRHLYQFTAHIPQDQKDDLAKCCEMMEKEGRRQPAGPTSKLHDAGPKISVDRVISSSRKRKRDTLCPPPSSTLVLKRGGINWNREGMQGYN